ncbi:3TM-type holin [Rubellimicrobium roseum]|uniref:Carboxylesterase n=1 Tax=Rubellimicrobium roseum TaxID=687525 RepID=A0A5C4NHJ7_9RHOB|nr:3TM-type holin [Rubellimicrobium roseum]TNC73345.1 carboxylesterase [Rubellimicrobium roseum]
MALTTNPLRWLAAPRSLEIAEGLRRHAEAQGLPPPVLRLDARPRAAFDRLVDALNRLPRPLATLGTLALFAAALIAPDWFAARMEALARMPEALWWLVGAVLSLHFGARVQAHAQEFQREILSVAAPVPDPAPSAGTPAVAAPGPDATLTLDTLVPGPNAALADWRGGRP